jgi:uncharacterized damage-inducible protein DinB
MHTSADTLRIHLAYSAWASARLLDAAQNLTPEELTRDFHTADQNVVGTLAHAFAGDRIWLIRVKGEPLVPFITPEDRHLDFLQKQWPALQQSWKSWMDPLTDHDTERIITYKDTKGNAWENPLWQILLHVVNHATHHRGQVSGFLRAMGHTPPPLDLIAYYRSL